MVVAGNVVVVVACGSLVVVVVMGTSVVVVASSVVLVGMGGATNCLVNASSGTISQSPSLICHANMKQVPPPFS